MAADSSSSTPAISTPSSTVVLASTTTKFDPHPVSIKLDDTNYLPWRQQAMATIKGYKLQSYLLGARVIPPQFLSATDEAQGKFNEAFLNWEQQDQLLLSWLLSSMSDSMLVRMVGCEHSFQVWSVLELFFASQTKAKINQLKTQLRNIKKGSLSATEYLLKVKKIVDSLSSVGAPLSESDHIDAILEGLPEDYNGFIVSLTSRTDPYTVNQVESLLTAQEERIEKFKKEVTPTMTANAAQVSSTTKPSRPSTPTDASQQKFSSPSFQNRGGRSNWRGRGRGAGRFTNTSNRLQCQVCGKNGHMAWQCFHRFNPQFTSPFSTPQTAFNRYNNFNSYPSHTPPSAPMQALLATPDTTSSAAWFPDSGASHHITSDINNLGSASEYGGSERIHIANGSGIKISHVGTSQVQVSSSSKPLYLNNILCVPSASKNLLSVSQFAADNRVFFEFHPNFCLVKCQDTKTVLIRGAVKNGLYTFDNLHLHRSISPSALSAQASNSSSLFHLWHCRLGHPSSLIVNTVLKQCSITTCNKFSSQSCVSCCMGKTHRLPFPHSSTSYTQPLQLIHCDVWGPAPLVSSNGFKYYIHFSDAYTKFTWLYLLKAKSDVASIFHQFKTMVELQFNNKIKSVQSDGGGEFIALKSYFNTHGITHRLSCPHTPQQNGLAERKHRHIIDMALTLLARASLPMKFWDEAILTSIYLINRLPTPLLHLKSPFEVLYGSPPDYNHLKTFGCACYPNLRPYNTNKLQFRSTQCTFLGYSSSHKGYRCLDSNGRIYISRDVLFDEHTFPYSTSPSIASPSVSSPLVSHPTPSIPIIPISSNSQPLCDDSAALINTDLSFSPNHTAVTNSAVQPTGSLSNSPQSIASSSSSGSSTRYMIAPSVTAAQFTREPSTPTSFSLVSRPILTNQHSMHTRAKSGIYKPKALTASVVPTSVKAALAQPQWHTAMQQEFEALQRNNTWDLVPLPQGRKPIGCKWVFRIKENPDGSLNKHKARLVAKGFHQQPGFEFTDTFSPVVKPVTIRVVLTIALSHGWSIRQLDVNNAFLNGHLHEELYMSQPPGFHQGSVNTVCRLKKSLYGLRQAPRAWFDKLSSTLHNFGFVTAKSDPSLFIKKTHHSIVYILVYVDDIIVTGSNSRELDALITSLHNQFALKDLGPLHYFLGIQVTPTAHGGLLLTQTKYVNDLLHRCKMQDAKPVSTPMAASTKLTNDGSDYFDDPHLYRATVGALQYACLTRPDLAYCVNKVSQFMSKPLLQHWLAVKRILRYLAGTKHMGILLSSCHHPRLSAMSDADWASDLVDRRSTSGFCVYFGSNLVAWSSKKQPVVSRSSTEAEYRALALAVSELTWLRSLLHELRYPLSNEPPIIFCDNQSTVQLSANPVLHSRSKHLELDLHFVREKVQSKLVAVTHISSTDQIADALTKPLAKSQFFNLRSKLSVQGP